MSAAKSANTIFPITAFTSDLQPDFILQYLPSSSEHGPVRRRLVIVGDVHGMRKSLEALLDQVGFNKSKGDHLVLVGDLVNKGPDSPGVVDLAMKLGASAVRGNHENAVLNAAAEINATHDREGLGCPGGLPGSPAIPKPPEVGATVRDSEIPDKSGSATMTDTPTSHSTALGLLKRQLQWLAALPLIVRVKLPHVRTSSVGDALIVVHAGLVPGLSLKDQDPHTVMHMRSLVRASGNEERFIPAEIPGEESWVVEWDRWQDRQASKTTVIFGHDAKRGLQLGKYAIGLDSGCLYGHQLSAVVITAFDGKIEHHIVQVDCADTPIAPTASVKEGEKIVVVSSVSNTSG
ncbi:Ser/Thr protein phosphatase family protein [Penicillium digitatum PHI26]|uniref:Ser/Thr protein phosphatase family protein n=2 Tax=Penicillium digitatum TaxID=36651 RepID=K9FTQ0_PEND2|nr:Ser/Thr protein phosphatase family protein [Penicillium digitatum Pd1]EKV12499.1 Ser/Thr protein phosphatase family protein [Penicillium digitatum PHI26]EKV16496.1 Ser/Thr protein phosphatase family protein [Penicillium digitatum Pd1]KAG0158065.1 hypothetical protein PDIDSM_5578 [Penicillium digitatum]